MEVKPLYDCVLIRRLPEQEKTEGEFLFLNP
jgi:hypothetical protein